VTGTVRLGIGTRLRHDGDLVEVVEVHGTTVVLRDGRGRVTAAGVVELLAHPDRTQLIADRAELSTGDGEPAGVVWSLLDEDTRARVQERAAHVREVLTGYRSGTAELAADGEPRAGYRPDVGLMQRYENKAHELGVSTIAVRKWVAAFRQDGEAGLAPRGVTRPRDALGGVDPRWLDAARAVIDERTGRSTPTKALVLQTVEARLVGEFGEGVVPAPSRSKGYQLLGELSRGRNTFAGSAKGRRSIANRPVGVYGRLRATRPGEYLVLDTTPLDVFAMEPVTLRWVGAELTIAMDLYTRCIAGLRLTPVSTKSVDVASVIYQALRPRPVPDSWPAQARWPYHGIPTALVVNADHVDGPAHRGMPAVVPETLVVDHGRVYVSAHVTSACARVGISIQPARPYTPTDKPVERFFRTLRQGLLEALPGYKGPDVFSRGEKVEQEAFFFLDELEAIIREWVAVVYHHRPHDGLVDPHVPGMTLSPAQMFEHGVARAGYLQVPADPTLVYEFLQVAWRRIHHYGVEVAGLRYHGQVLVRYANRTSGYPSAQGRWPIHVDPDDVSRVFFRDPHDGTWHTLTWEHAPALGAPFSAEALAYARRLAACQDRFPDDRRTLAELLARWDAGLADTPAERRMALRLAQQRAALDLPDPRDDAEQVAKLDSVRQVVAAQTGTDHDNAADIALRTVPDLAGDDDEEADLDYDDGEEPEGAGVDFYADALEALR